MTAPPTSVRRAFGATGPAVLLPGGQGRTWRAGDVVVKRGWRPETEWRAALYVRTCRPVDDALVPADGAFRVPRPIAADGAWWHDGWEAWRLLPGVADPSRVDDIVRIALAFAEVFAREPDPAFLDDRDDPWAAADRAAFGEAPVPDSPFLARLLAAAAPVQEPSTLVHGDLLGNVLFEPGNPPTVIDWPPYRRPATYGAAIAVVDALCWHDAPMATLDRWQHLPQWISMCARALVFRIATDVIVRPGAVPHAAYGPVVTAVLDRL